MAPVRALAKKVRDERKPVAGDNPFVAFQEQISRQVVSTLDAAREMSERLSERVFLSVYGSPMLQAAVGVDPVATNPLRKAPHNPLHRQLLQARIDELKSHIAKGGVREGLIRAWLYVGMNRDSVDERGFETVRRIRRAQKDLPSLPLPAFKSLVREQFYMLLIDRESCLAALPALVPDTETRRKILALVREVLSSRGPLTDEEEDRMHQVAHLFGLNDQAAGKPQVAILPPPKSREQRKVS
jgi:hypothetical protein